MTRLGFVPNTLEQAPGRGIAPNKPGRLARACTHRPTIDSRPDYQRLEERRCCWKQSEQ